MIATDKQSAAKLFRMISSELVSYKHTMPWCEARIQENTEPLAWLCELAVTKYGGDLKRIVTDFLNSEPFERFNYDLLDRYELGCLFLRHQRREISWATFLREAGSLSDAAESDPDCEWFYERLNRYEDSGFNKSLETTQRAEVLTELSEIIEDVAKDYEPFRLLYQAGDDG